MGLRAKFQKPMAYDDPVLEEQTRNLREIPGFDWSKLPEPMQPGAMTNIAPINNALKEKFNRQMNTPEEKYMPYSEDPSWSLGAGVDRPVASLTDIPPEPDDIRKMGASRQFPQEGTNLRKELAPQPQKQASVRDMDSYFRPTPWGMGDTETGVQYTPKEAKTAAPIPAIAQAVAKKKDPRAFLGEMQSSFIDPYRLHTANMANQMRASVGDVFAAVPGVKPLSNIDYRQPVMDEITYRQQVEARDRQRLQDQLAYMKALESDEADKADWAVIDTKGGTVRYNKRTGEVEPVSTYGQGEGPVGELTPHTDDIIDDAGNVKKFDYFTDKYGNVFAYNNTGEIKRINPNLVRWATKNQMQEEALKLSAEERKRVADLNIRNLGKGLGVGFKGNVPANTEAALASAEGVAQTYRDLMADKRFVEMTTKSADAKTNVDKVIALNNEIKGNGARYQSFIAAQATAVGSGVVNEGERLNYIGNMLGLPSDLFTNPAYRTDPNIKLSIDDMLRAGAMANLMGRVVSAGTIEELRGRMMELARKHPSLVDPSRMRRALRDITINAVRRAQDVVELQAVQEVPSGGLLASPYDERVGAYFKGLMPEDETEAPAPYSWKPVELVEGPAAAPTARPTVTPTSRPVKKKFNINTKKPVQQSTPKASPTPTPVGKGNKMFDPSKKY